MAASVKEAGIRGWQPLGKKRGSRGGSPWQRSRGPGAAAPGIDYVSFLHLGQHIHFKAFRFPSDPSSTHCCRLLARKSSAAGDRRHEGAWGTATPPRGGHSHTPRPHPLQ